MEQILQIGAKVNLKRMVADGIHTEDECTVIDIFRSLQSNRLFLEVEFLNEEGNKQRQFVPLITTL